MKDTEKIENLELNLRNVESQIEDRTADNTRQNRQIEVNEQYYKGLLNVQRRGQDVQMVGHGARAAAASARQNRPPKAPAFRLSAAEQTELKGLQNDYTNAATPQEKDAAMSKIRELEAQAQFRHKAQYELGPGLAADIRSGALTAEQAVEAARESGLSDVQIKQVFDMAGVPLRAPAQAGGAQAPATPRQGVQLPSNRPAPPPSGPSPVIRDAPPARAPAAPVSQMEEAGRALDAARAQFRSIRAERAPGLAAGSAARQAYADRLAAARKRVEAAEAAYQATLPAGVGAAFVHPKP